MRQFWAYLGRGCLAAAGSSVLLMLSNEPADVTSRISHWYEFWQGQFARLPEMPHWLTDPAADIAAYAVGFGLIALAATPTLLGWFRSRRKPTPAKNAPDPSASASEARADAFHLGFADMVASRRCDSASLSLT
jgi:hypothetical protein